MWVSGVGINLICQNKGVKWAGAHPDRASDLWVVATVLRKRTRKYIGPPTPENLREAERKRAAWASLLDGAEISDAPTFREAGDAYLLIETDRPRVVVHRRTDNGFVAELYEGLDAVIELEAIEAELPLVELYERVEFAASEK